MVVLQQLVLVCYYSNETFKNAFVQCGSKILILYVCLNVLKKSSAVSVIEKHIIFKKNLTCVSIPIVNSIRKKRTAQTGDIGKLEIASGYVMNTKPGPAKYKLHKS